jgi:hypothetical protein
MNSGGELLEIIHLRLSADCSEKLLDDIYNSATGLQAGTELKIYRHWDLSGDISIHILNQSSGGKGLKSSVGIHLASELREFGTVYHSLWIEKPGIST